MNIKHIIFKDIKTSTYHQLTKKAELKKYSKGEIIHFQTEQCTSIDLIIEGQVEVEHLNEDGSRLIVRIFHPNEIIGINVTFSSNPFYIMNFVAKNNVTILRINKETLEEEMIRDKTFMENILRNLSDKSLKIGSRIKNEFKVTIRNQLITYLLSLYTIQKSNPVTLPMSKLELSEHFGVSRTSFSRELSKMEEEKLLKMIREKI